MFLLGNLAQYLFFDKYLLRRIFCYIFIEMYFFINIF